jgi:GT2 family glycosyltransferase
MPRTLYKHNPELIYQDGQVLHYVGATWAIHRNAPVKGLEDQPRLSIGWGVQLIDRHKAAEMGNFNEGYVMGWGDDGEFNHKMNLAGHFCYHIPSAVVYHMRTEGARRYYGTVRNRWRFLLETYQWKTLLLCLPSLMVYELSLVLFLFKKGAIKDYFQAVAHVLGNLRPIFETRKTIQSKRKLKDKDLMTSGTVFVAPEYINSKVLSAGFKGMNAFLNGYWFLVRGLL